MQLRVMGSRILSTLVLGITGKGGGISKCSWHDLPFSGLAGSDATQYTQAPCAINEEGVQAVQRNRKRAETSAAWHGSGGTPKTYAPARGDKTLYHFLPPLRLATLMGLIPACCIMASTCGPKWSMSTNVFW